MDIRMEKAAPSDAAMLLEYLKQVGGKNISFDIMCLILL